MPCFGDLPELLRGKGCPVVRGVEFLAAATPTRVDEEEWTRGDAPNEIRERGWRTRAAQDRDGRCLDCRFGERQPAAWAANEILADRPYPCSFRDDGAEPGVGGGGLEHHLAADRETDSADAAVGDVGPFPQPGDGGIDVLGPGPAEEVRVS